MDTSGKSHCAWCGEALSRRFVEGAWRLVCPSCGRITYENPTVGAAGILFAPDGRVLLVRRARGETREGHWCLPCGHIEYNEDIRHGLVRELREETGFLTEPVSVYTVYSNFHEPKAHTVGIWFLVRTVGGICQSGDDASEAEFFALDQLPQLAFETDRMVLQSLKEMAQAAAKS